VHGRDVESKAEADAWGVEFIGAVGGNAGVEHGATVFFLLKVYTVTALRASGPNLCHHGYPHVLTVGSVYTYAVPSTSRRYARFIYSAPYLCLISVCTFLQLCY
jgi:hypothetical protein